MDTDSPLAPGISNPLTDCRRIVRFARAVDLANSKRYLEAEALLVASGRERLTLDEIDLCARIAIQTGRYERARHLWLQAFKEVPEIKDFENLAALAEEAGRKAYLKRQVIFGVLVSVATAAILLVAWAQFQGQGNPVPGRSKRSAQSPLGAPTNGHPLPTNQSTNRPPPSKALQAVRP